MVCKRGKHPANMMNLELNIERIKQISKARKAENYEFRAFLKGLDSVKVDKIVHKLNNEIVSRIDCRECGNCCRLLRPYLTVTEIEVLSQIDNISKKEYIQKYVKKDDIEETKYLKVTPCRYLNDKSCTIYESRPFDCESYPHTHKKDFTSRTWGMIANYEICPIVFNLFELLKQKLNFKAKS